MLSFNGVTLSGIVTGDSVSLNANNYTASFPSARVGNGIAVTVSGLTLNGPSASDYTLAQPSNLFANITVPSAQVVSDPPNIVIFWTTNASVFVLNQTDSLNPPVAWSPVTNAIAISGTNNTVVVNASSGPQYFTLIAPP